VGFIVQAMAFTIYMDNADGFGLEQHLVGRGRKNVTNVLALPGAVAMYWRRRGMPFKQNPVGCGTKNHRVLSPAVVRG